IDRDSLNSDLSEMTKLMKNLLSENNQHISLLYQEINSIKKTVIDVACKPFIHPNSKEEVQIFYGQLAILGKFIESPNILKFYGLSKIDGKDVMVFDWAEMGNLREVYLKSAISWETKIKIAHGICR
ncbi:15948_t:CDS:2, partial [Cetraspora pellucida]